MDWFQMTLFDGEKPYKINKPIRLIELFAGIGAQAKALQNIGADFEHYRICEFDKYAVQSYNAVHGTQFETSDITKINASDLGITDTDKYEYIMTYSFPCQSLSKAGKGEGMAKGSGTRSGLLWEVERLLDECEELPQVLLMENVPDVIGTKNISHFANWIKKLETLGYHNYWKLLNAKDYGIPQNRNRCYMVSLLGDYYYNFPQGFPLELRLKDMLETEVDEKYYLSEKAIKGLAKTKFNCSTLENRTSKKGIMPTLCARDYKDPKLVCEPRLEQVAQLDGFESSGRIYSENGLCPTINTMGGGGREPKIAEPLAYDEQNKILRVDGTVGTLTTDGSSPKHNNRVIYTYNECCESLDLDKPFEIISVKLKTRTVGAILQNGTIWFVRKLTPLETWRLMGFDDKDFYNASNAGASNSQLYKQAGNSIVVKVLEAIFKQMTAKVEV